MRYTARRTSTVAWLPSARTSLLAAGTAAGALDATFSSNSELEIFGVDYSAGQQNNELSLRVSVPSNSRFQRIAWGSQVTPTAKTQHGFIACGFDNGVVDIWNATSLLASGGGSAAESSRLAHNEHHKGPVRGLDFNPLQDNLLASGSQDGDICIWDLNNPTQHYTPGARSQRLGDISSLAWNRKVSHILATGSVNSSMVIWDLKTKREVVALPQPRHIGACSAIQWNPDVPTQLITAHELSNHIYVWDLRNVRAPEKTLEGHQGGILSLSWCPSDPTLLLSSGKDNLALCWNPATSEYLGQFAQSSNWIFDIQWSPRNPALVATSSYDGEIAVTSVHPSPYLPVEKPRDVSDVFSAPVESTSALALVSAPKWMRRPHSASFGFGGKLVSFGPGDRRVHMRHVAIQSDMVNHAVAFDQVAETGDFGAFCAEKADSASSLDESTMWRFLNAFIDSSDARQSLLRQLGFDRDAVQRKLASLRVADEHDTPAADENGDTASSLFTGSGDSASFSVGGGELAPSMEPFRLFVQSGDDSDPVSTSIMEALLVRDYDSAVDICFAAHRTSDALLLASLSSSAPLLRRTQSRVLLASSSPSYLRLISAIASSELSEIIQNVELSDWRAALAALCSHSTETDFAPLAQLLGKRLEEAHLLYPALLCYICAGSLAGVGGIWEGAVKAAAGEEEGARELQVLVEKVAVMRKVMEKRGLPVVYEEGI